MKTNLLLTLTLLFVFQLSTAQSDSLRMQR